MFFYKTPIASYQRLLENDISNNFLVIFKIKCTDDESSGFMIETQKQITINTTINKACVISKVIDDKYLNDPSVNQYVFNLENSDQNQIIHVDDIVEILHELFGNKLQIQISEHKKGLFNQIINIFNNEVNQTNDSNIITCQYKNSLFAGIISYLKQHSNGKLDGNTDELKISAGGDQNNSYPLSNLILYEDNNIYQCYVNAGDTRIIPKSEAWIEFDFVSRKVDITSYSIRTIYNPTNEYHPKTWKILGSNDHENWSLIDEQIDNSILNGSCYSAHIQCGAKSQFYKYIRYFQLKNWKPSNSEIFYENYIGLSSIEFFGSIMLEQNQ